MVFAPRSKSGGYLKLKDVECQGRWGEAAREITFKIKNITLEMQNNALPELYRLFRSIYESEEVF